MNHLGSDTKWMVSNTNQNDELKSHNHSIPMHNDGGNVGVRYQGGSPSSTIDSGSSGGSETRPKNAAVIYIIKY